MNWEEKNAAQVSLICGGVSTEYLLKIEAVGRMMNQNSHFTKELQTLTMLAHLSCKGFDQYKW